MPSVSGVTSGLGFSQNEPKTNELGQEAFLQLLTTQLQYQDPLNPQSDTDFIAQLAQFSSLEQLRSVNQNLDTIELYQISLNNSNALNLVGKEVNIQDGELNHVEGQEHKVNYTIPPGADAITITIKDEDGRTVKTVDLDGSQPGESDFTWGGMDDAGNAVSEGTYSIEITARDDEGNSINLGVYQRLRVDGLAYENGGILLIVGDRKLPIDGVNEVYDGNRRFNIKSDSNSNFKTQVQPAFWQMAYGR